ncbi:MAG: MBL fold metallo-hydrolase [Calditrichaeota bacterium]|nr:MAG: MBL fold metallo-hydrolase [Calditrichota bacterium]
MQIRFCGGARTVTGSQHLLTINGKKILLECGLFQGRRKDTYERNKNFLYDPKEIDVMVLSHAHIDHCGNIPNLVNSGFEGYIFATAATVDLCQIMLRDSAYLQEKDIEWVNKIRRRHHEPPAEPLYTVDDVENAMMHFVGVQYNKRFPIAPGVTVTFFDAGHILGSAVVLLEIEEKGKRWRLGFSGDLGRKNIPILRDPQPLHELDLFICESTYGNREHEPSEGVEEEVAQTVNQVIQERGKIIIPAFALGRTQLIVYILHKLFTEKRIPDLPIYVDSPLACNATEVFRHHPECFDRETYALFLQNHLDPFGFGRLKYIRDVEESKKLNYLNEPCIIISASGMAEAGRILHHLRNNIQNPRNLVLLVGFAAQNTLARKLKDGWEKVKIFGQEYPVKCKVKSIDAFSAHADRHELLDYYRGFSPEKLKHIFLVHGEEDQALPFQQALKSRGFTAVHYPAWGEVVKL